MRPQIVSDDASIADLGPEPKGWFDGAEADVEAWVQIYGQEDDGNTD